MEAKLRKDTANNVYAFASLLDVDGDDVSYLEKRYLRINSILTASKRKLLAGHEVIKRLSFITLILLFCTIDVIAASCSQFCITV